MSFGRALAWLFTVLLSSKVAEEKLENYVERAISFTILPNERARLANPGFQYRWTTLVLSVF